MIKTSLILRGGLQCPQNTLARADAENATLPQVILRYDDPSCRLEKTPTERVIPLFGSINTVNGNAARWKSDLISLKLGSVHTVL